jgi:hypothetical protein
VQDTTYPLASPMMTRKRYKNSLHNKSDEILDLQLANTTAITTNIKKEKRGAVPKNPKKRKRDEDLTA